MIYYYYYFYYYYDIIAIADVSSFVVVRYPHNIGHLLLR